MATLHVRNVPDDLYARLQQLASAQNRDGSRPSRDLIRECLASPDTAASKRDTPYDRNHG